MKRSFITSSILPINYYNEGVPQKASIFVNISPSETLGDGLFVIFGRPPDMGSNSSRRLPTP
jgi:hypothetical protein